MTIRLETSIASSWSCVTKSVVTFKSWCRVHQPFAEFLANLGIHGAERLVQQQHAGLGRQRTGDGHALALAAGKLMRDSASPVLPGRASSATPSTRASMSARFHFLIFRPKAMFLNTFMFLNNA